MLEPGGRGRETVFTEHPQRVRVKICGLTDLDTCRVAIEAGADMLGFNFYPKSSRYITPAACAEIIERLESYRPGVCLVGVFVNSPPAEVAAILKACRLDLAQLSGDEPPGDLVEITELAGLTDIAGLDQITGRDQGTGCGQITDRAQGTGQGQITGRAFKALRPKDSRSLEEAVRRYQPLPGALAPTPRFLLDAHIPGVYGGSGQPGDWALAADLSQRMPILLAGGLNPENVAQAVAQARPWGVDVASGVESGPGRKDPEKIRLFIQQARQNL